MSYMWLFGASSITSILCEFTLVLGIVELFVKLAQHIQHFILSFKSSSTVLQPQAFQEGNTTVQSTANFLADEELSSVFEFDDNHKNALSYLIECADADRRVWEKDTVFTVSKLVSHCYLSSFFDSVTTQFIWQKLGDYLYYQYNTMSGYEGIAEFADSKIGLPILYMIDPSDITSVVANHGFTVHVGAHYYQLKLSSEELTVKSYRPRLPFMEEEIDIQEAAANWLKVIYDTKSIRNSDELIPYFLQKGLMDTETAANTLNAYNDFQTVQIRLVEPQSIEVQKKFEEEWSLKPEIENVALSEEHIFKSNSFMNVPFPSPWDSATMNTFSNENANTVSFDQNMRNNPVNNERDIDPSAPDAYTDLRAQNRPQNYGRHGRKSILGENAQIINIMF
ncbi:hypothetical protein SJAG_01306 [Schizosaccharomyces japonicus yFS275]|uniref:Uncharacterized protein n=1 Tax=Schizosaccharomyces japonicus (strain yFS275 / FY16936) TaxID=402676 RepID=B6K0B2_SCHJY|nr:hypothetical protein SJAG_01306 [Schizosaccharomyces japonicus yFS275]EEB06262.1 hypothetical protein SJAG_01306 [Schizosaccharomyces japonicus yFS275]